MSRISGQVPSLIVLAVAVPIDKKTLAGRKRLDPGDHRGVQLGRYAKNAMEHRLLRPRDRFSRIRIARHDVQEQKKDQQAEDRGTPGLTKV